MALRRRGSGGNGNETRQAFLRRVSGVANMYLASGVREDGSKTASGLY